MKGNTVKPIRHRKTAEDIRDILVQSDIDAGITVEAAVARLRDFIASKYALDHDINVDQLASQTPWFDARTAALQYYYTHFDFRTLQRMLRELRK